MKKVKRSKQFDKDAKLMVKRGKKIKKLKDIVELLVHGKLLPAKYRDHQLKNIERVRELHIEPDWLLIYKIDGQELHLKRTGSHSDLFN